jgi:hypothetical protein
MQTIYNNHLWHLHLQERGPAATTHRPARGQVFHAQARFDCLAFTQATAIRCGVASGKLPIAIRRLPDHLIAPMFFGLTTSTMFHAGLVASVRVYLGPCDSNSGKLDRRILVLSRLVPRIYS